jgi:hypothetical protein
LRQVVAEATPPKEGESLVFCTPNLTLEEYRALSDEEESRLVNEVYEVNREWVDQELQERGAIWIAVINGQVVASSPNIDFPDGPRIRALSATTGKRPFIFVDKSRFVIEETTGWNVTRYADDYYPTVPVIIAHESESVSASVVADFDTASNHTYLPFEELAGQGIVQPLGDDERGIEFHHLGKPFRCVSRFARCKLGVNSPSQEQALLFVLNWQTSPMVQINPIRAALVGRDLPTAIKSKMELDFEARTTTVITR